MRAEWKIRKLGDVAEVIAGQSPEGSFYNSLGQGLPFYQGKKEFGERYIGAPTTWTTQITKVALEGDVLMSVRAPVGPVNFATEKCCIGRGLAAIRSRNGLDKKFLFYFLLSKQDDISGTEGAVFASINKNDIQQMPIGVPLLPEQQRIVGILDEAFEGIATAAANAERNLQSARALFESYLQAIFTPRGEGWTEKSLGDVCDLFQGLCINAKTKHLLVAESSLPLLRIKDLRNNTAEQFIAETGWPKNAKVDESEIIYTRTGQIGLVFRGRAGVLHNNCFKVKPRSVLNKDYLFWWLQNPVFRDRIIALASKAAQPDITHSLFKAQPIQVPPLDYQDEAISLIDNMLEHTQRLESIYQRKLAALDELKKSLLHQAFTGELTKQSRRTVVIPFPTKIPGITTTDLHAGILATAFQLHEKNGKQKYFGHVKAEKIAHMVEAHLGIELGRTPVKDAAGPNDFHHLKAVEHRAKMAKFFDFHRVEGMGYRVKKHRQFDEVIERTRGHLGKRSRDLDNLLELMLPMNTEQAEVFVTVYAAWNNLLLDKQPITDESIVFEARENWHPDKLNIERRKFFKAIEWMKEHGVIPQGRGKKVNSRVEKKK